MSKLPDWFSLNNYENNLTAEEWAVEIAVRNLFHGSRGFHGSADNFFNIVVNNDDSYRQRTLQKLLEGARDREGVPPILVTNAYDLSESVQKSMEEYSLIMREIFKRQEFLSLNLDRTDRELVDELKKYLKKRRKSDAEVRVFNKGIVAELPAWSGFKLLPLFDLLCWRTLSQPELKYEIIGEGIWPEDRFEGIEVTQKIRKKGRPLIKSVFKHFVPYNILRELGER